MAACATIGGFLVAEEYMAVVRYFVCGLFLLGPLCAVIGYLRFMPAGPTMTALLALLIDKSGMFTIMGVGSLIITLSGSGSVEPTPGLIATYALFSASGGAMLFAGLFVLFGAGRGWIAMDVYKFFWWRR